MKGLPRSLYQSVIQGVIPPPPPPEVVPPTEAPVVVDAPFASQTGNQLNCTMGNWNGEPTSRTYQWKVDGADVAGATASTHTVVVGDIGKSFTCVQTATNAVGTSTPVTSNAVVVSAA